MDQPGQVRDPGLLAGPDRVLEGVEQYLASRPGLAGSTAIYGGSAGPGLLSRGRGRIGGLFLATIGVQLVLGGIRTFYET